jgi:hypothetical protein
LLAEQKAASDKLEEQSVKEVAKHVESMMENE